MTLLRFGLLLVGIVVAATEVYAQPLPPFPPDAEVLPQPVTAGQPLTVRVQTNVRECLYEVVQSELSVSGTTLVIDFEVATTPNVCVTPPLLTFDIESDGLSAGDYELVLNGAYSGVTVEPVIIPFGVLPPAVSVPVGRWMVPGLGLVLLLFGWCRLRNS